MKQTKSGTIKKFVGQFMAVRGLFFRKTLISILFIASIPGLIIGGGIYWIAIDQIEKAMLTSHENQIKQRAQELDEQLSYLKTTLTHWAFDPMFNDSMLETDYLYQFQKTRELNQSLLIKKGTHPFLDNLQLFLYEPQPLVFDPITSVTPLTTQEGMLPYQHLPEQQSDIFWESSSVSDDGSTIRLVHQVPGGTPRKFGALIAYVNLNKIEQQLETMLPSGDGVGLIINHDSGDMIVHDRHSEGNELQDLVLSSVLSRSDDQSTFVMPWNGNTYSVSYGNFERVNMEWTYISAVPMTAITAPVVFTSKIILYVSMAGIVLAVLLSWMISRRIYTPIGRMVRLLQEGSGSAADRLARDEFRYLEVQWESMLKQSAAMQHKLSDQLPYLKEGFLLQLIHDGLGSYTEEELKERMKQLGWKLDNRHMLVLSIQLLGFSNRKGRLTSKDEDLFTFAAANIVEELAKAKLEQVSVINLHDMSIGLLVFMHEEQDMRTEVNDLCREVMEAIQRLLKLYVAITVSRSTAYIKHVPHLFAEVKEALLLRDCTLRNQIIDLEQVEDFCSDEEMRYSFSLERKLVQAMRTGQREEANLLITEFLNQLAAGGATEAVVQQGMLQLLGKMQNTMLQCGMNPHRLFKGSNMYERLSQIRGAEEMLEWMKGSVAGPFFDEMEERSHDRLREIVDKAVTYMHDNYMRDISLDECAEHAGTNHYSLSKAFKQYVGKNFIDYLTELRMDKAKELIRDTGLKIYDIAERVGYQHSYFNRIFKKLEGMTPRQYRELSRK
ncbi:helix-turn-helix domain-containing protein [Marinicrinis lubricantis]|uniref:Helix-turn-helix domain-containing protein n=1 Tax=Marinicrinis lubricantis TaxID=2086470 RepID=A0ABW1IQ06_9BACL